MTPDHHHAILNGVRLHYVSAGTPGAPLIVLLHGFPEFWYAWRHQLAPLARAGYRVVAPDLRGYNASEKPPGVRAYRLSELVADVAALIQHEGASRAVMVGHDWGGVIAWAFAMRRPELTERLVVLNAPHPRAYRRELKRRPEQRRRSAYVAYFQLPWLPEQTLRFALPRLFRRTATPGAFTDEDLRAYREAFAQPGALSATINYYRALLRHPSESRAAVIEAPTLLIWGEQDVALVPQLTEDLGEWVPDLRVARLPHATHWVQHDDPLRVTQLILAFLHPDDPGFPPGL
ncbi:alpha/beta fold hydrolase [Deinococcus maricopensis]|uniref:Soluble epoxide hydrolase n=1 Tax=Deinococcus maricopensis (strain DSM 21211 / LMG 22137 / NRRL B-23946 / LB-34) TaxID=709986 RepID=E8U4S3_DEIML|nr:alpha/beta hydrolase [Deinococcus maricopensis]ADV66062.1 Soluble epoxide hydrolase [Deinococcus maricopensis DSM 21211]